ncbi:MAG: argininosuccinate synthase [Burkholderiaceae bacterium]|nr:argininosuccinate synthase [Burkholderiaceae bacterium]
MSEIKKAVLAYSGGLDTSVILKWLQDTYGCEIVTFTADLGQGEELEPARAKALQFGIKPEHIFIDDLREEFVRDFVFPMFRANTIYEGEYLLGTSIARPLIAKRQIEIARQVGADAVSHGATGKGNDQVRFELGYYALEPGIKVIAPWREWDLLSREKLLAYAEKHGIPVEMKHKQGGAPYSMDANLLHISFEGRHLENPNAEAEEAMWRWTNGYWWSPERLALQTLIDHTQKAVSGIVRLKLYKGSVSVLARDSANTLFDQNIATFDDDGGAYNQADAGGFIKLNALRMRIAEIAKRKRAK